MKNSPRQSRQKSKSRSQYHMKGKIRQPYDSTPLHKGEVTGSEREGLPVNRSTLRTFYNRISSRGLNPTALSILYDTGYHNERPHNK